MKSKCRYKQVVYTKMYVKYVQIQFHKYTELDLYTLYIIVILMSILQSDYFLTSNYM